MKSTKVNVALLKSELSKYLNAVKQGTELIITSHGRDVARLVPLGTKEAQAINWKEYLKNHRPAKLLKKPAFSSGEIVRKIRDED